MVWYPFDLTTATPLDVIKRSLACHMGRLVAVLDEAIGDSGGFAARLRERGAQPPTVRAVLAHLDDCDDACRAITSKDLTLLTPRATAVAFACAARLQGLPGRDQAAILLRAERSDTPEGGGGTMSGLTRSEATPLGGFAPLRPRGRNPIVTALGHDVSGHDPATTEVVIRWRGAVLTGTLASGPYCESYSKSAAPCVSNPVIAAPYARSAEDALRVLASTFAGPNPKPGRVREIADRLMGECVVTFRRRRT
jgi:hypothetical protein